MNSEKLACLLANVDAMRHMKHTIYTLPEPHRAKMQGRLPAPEMLS